MLSPAAEVATGDNDQGRSSDDGAKNWEEEKTEARMEDRMKNGRQKEEWKTEEQKVEKEKAGAKERPTSLISVYRRNLRLRPNLLYEIKR